MCAFVFTQSMAIGVKSFICTYFLHEPINCEKSQLRITLRIKRVQVRRKSPLHRSILIPTQDVLEPFMFSASSPCQRRRRFTTLIGSWQQRDKRFFSKGSEGKLHHGQTIQFYGLTNSQIHTAHQIE